MNKTLLLAGVACLFAAQANANDFNQYVSAKVSRAQVSNDANNNFLQKSGNDVVLKGTVIDEKAKDDVNGLRFAYGLEKNISSINGSIRTELEYGINNTANENGKFDFKYGHIQVPSKGDFSQKMSINTVMVNMYYDYNLSDKITPYIGGGIGLAHLKTSGNVIMPMPMWGATHSETAQDREDNFAWNVSLGVGYKLTENITTDLGYRYTNYGSIKNSSPTGSSSYKVDSQELSAGVRYSF